jgi:leucyl aminopeptidase
MSLVMTQAEHGGADRVHTAVMVWADLIDRSENPVATISLSADLPSAVAGDALVVGIAKRPGRKDRGKAGGGRAGRGTAANRSEGPIVVGPDADGPLSGLSATLRDLGVVGNTDEVVRVPAPDGVAASIVVVTGLGEAKEAYDAETLRRAAGAATRVLAGRRTVVLGLPTPDAVAVEAVATGALLGAYAFNGFRGRTADQAKDAVHSLVVATGPDLPARQGRAAVARARALADAVTLTRDLVNTPPNAMTPADMAEVARREANGVGLDVSVLDDKALRKGGYGGILGVGQGSANKPRLVRIAYRHPRAKRHLAIVGKGITFDSGGISIKPAAGMEAMKSDMSGAAAVLGTLLAVAALKPQVNVTGWMPLAENMPGGGSQRPSDVLTTYGGRTVEVLNTDAEGRLVLADALVAAAEDDPDAIVDVATLTGAARVALGARTAGIMANDDAFRAAVHDAAGRVGEASWQMPIPDEIRRGLDSPVADIANVDNARLGGMLAGGAFLRDFVDSGTKWAHIDIAGPAYHETAPFGYTHKGGTGFAVRTLVQLAEDMAAGQI